MLLGIMLIFIVLEIIFRILPVNEGPHLLPVNEVNPMTRYEENRTFTWSNTWKFSIVTKKHSNNYGFLCDHNYHRRTEKSPPIMAIIGDSYVAALQVENSKTMHGLLSKKVGTSGKIYSFGSTGAPLSTYLAYAEYVHNEFHPNSMVFIIIGNDFDESLLRYKQVPGFHYFQMSRDGKLFLKRIDYSPGIIKKIARQSALIRYIFLNLRINWISISRFFKNTEISPSYTGNTFVKADQERLSDSKKVVNEFLNQLPSLSGLEPVNILFLVDGIRYNLHSEVELRNIKESYFEIMRDYFIDLAERNGYVVIDMQSIFINNHKIYGKRFEFKTDGHWNALGHKLVAEQIESSSVFLRTFSH